jgi:2-polyprenyl-3-methyl-5-hydroxy-6-metoxy-1,4-benzoquinol methylase
MNNGLIETIDVQECVCGRRLSNDFVITHDYSYKTCLNEFQFVKCECGSFTLKNRPIEEEIHRIYPNNYDAYRPSSRRIVQLARNINFRRKMNLIERFEKSDSWLDYGCGAGEFAIILKQSGVRNVYAIDSNASTPKALEANGVLFADAINDEAISDCSIDVISLLQVIEHLADPGETVSQLAKKMKQGGILLIETPAPSGLDFNFGVSGTWGGWHAPRHFYIFSKKTLVALLEKSGFEILKSSFIPSPYLWAETLKARRLLKNKQPMPGVFAIGNPLFILCIALGDVLRILFGRSTSNQRIIARKKH